ncbi:MAG: helix-turn-helix domain-containing protein [Marmoricola sp.]
MPDDYTWPLDLVALPFPRGSPARHPQAVAVSVTILDAAQNVFETYGARRANLEDVARAAGVSKSTLYRAYQTKDQLLDAVLARQLIDFFVQLDKWPLASPREAVAECFTRGLALTREIPLLGRLFEAEPEVITQANAE